MSEKRRLNKLKLTLNQHFTKEQQEEIGWYPDKQVGNSYIYTGDLFGKKFELHLDLTTGLTKKIGA
ncbi:hypothetical protein ACFWM3_19225 [Gottfriedia sp. NPDC058432]|uniref:hypothetical protein n=1 Tax=Gottfriedia sp. NPDC058432 TaxID=3346497 RepID=UPI00365CE955